MRILVDQSSYELMNMGDVAMLQSCVQRLSREWPDAEIRVFCRTFADLTTYCSGPTAIDRTPERGLASLIPQRYRPVWHSLMPYRPAWFDTRRPWQWRASSVSQAVRAADVVVAAGGGYLNDSFRWHATGVLGVLSLAQRLGKPTAMFGQGIGPLSQRMVCHQARAVLPQTASSQLARRSYE
jgi:polysaccharide pyruvyl transferase WcaK-like protein